MILPIIAADEGNNFQGERLHREHSRLNKLQERAVRWVEKNMGSVLAERGDFISDGALVSCEASRGVAPRTLQWRVMMAIVGTGGNFVDIATLVILTQASIIN